MQITTTLNKIKAHHPCSDGWSKLLKFLNKTESDDEPLNLLKILESNGVSDCTWSFRTTEDYPVYRLIAADFAESVLHLFEEKFPDDNRPRLAIQSARDYANGVIGISELDAAWDAAWDVGDAAWDAAMAAWAAGFTLNAAMAAWAAARAAGDAADSASSAAWDAELEKQREIILKHLS